MYEDIPDRYSATAKMLVKELLQLNPGARPSARDVLTKEFIRPLLNHLSAKQELEAEFLRLDIDGQRYTSSGKCHCYVYI